MKNKILSFILPSRGRLEMLKESLENIQSKFENYLDDIEVIIRLDLDDNESFSVLNEQYGFDIKYIIGDREKGYPSLPKFISQCYNLSDSYFFMLYNDDALIINHHNIIDKLKEKKDYISISAECETSQFPIIHYKIIEITGGFHDDVIYIDAHYDNVRLSLPETNQLSFELEIVHPKFTYEKFHLYYHRKDMEVTEDAKNNKSQFDGNKLLYLDIENIKKYFKIHGSTISDGE